MAAVILQKKRKKRVEAGHPWIFKSEIERVEGEPEPGSLVPVHSHNGQYLATGYYNPASQITVRVVSTEPLEAMTQEWFERKLQICRDLRERFVPEAKSYRLVYGEADGRRDSSSTSSRMSWSCKS
ncbi:hypothetical protein LJK87_18460 [Paenibacillus sp. P25]|nr:hypothetical protein LJK87_18460 [Paenibacillus sp. P25]